MECKHFNLEKLQNMFDKEQNLEELNKIMSAIADKQDILSNDNKETDNVQLEEKIYQQMNRMIHQMKMVKIALRMTETPAAMFENLCKKIKTRLIGAKLNSEEKARDRQRKINNIELWI